ncbi:MAG: MarR family transcriptional regulator, partial [Oxalobacteraceae bacterium]
VQRAARALARTFDTALKPVGLNNGQFSLMMSLNRPQPATMKSVCDLLAMDRTTLTAALKVLQARGWIGSAVDPKDKRGRLLTLTEDGRAVLAKSLPIWEATHAALDAALPDGNADELRSALKAVS